MFRKKQSPCEGEGGGGLKFEEKKNAGKKNNQAHT